MFKLVVWGFIGLMILPSLVETPSSGADDQHTQITDGTSFSKDKFSPSDAFQMAGGVLGYLKNICAHDAELCENGARLVDAAISRAKQGAVVIAGMVETHRAELAATNDPTTTASIK